MLLGFIIIILSAVRPALAEDAVPSAPPPYRLLRYDEDYSYLRNPANRSDFWDAVKFVPLNPQGDWNLSLGGEARERYEYFHNPSWGQPPNGNGYFLQRYLLHGDLWMGRHLRLFGQLQSSMEDGRRGGPRPTDEDELDLHQAFLDVKFNMGADGSIVLRSGRQELAYGSQRIISVREGPNVRQSFDGFRAIYSTGEVRIDGFATRPAETNRHIFDDGTDNNRGLWGIYSVFPLPVLPGGNMDLYYVGYYNRHGQFEQGTSRELRHSIGTRLWSTAMPLDYNIEFIYQWGSFGNGDIRAWTAASDTGYTVESLPMRPRFGLKANIASGDQNPNNPNLQSFNPLFPKGAYFSEDNLIGPVNFIDFNPSVDLHLANNLHLTVNCDFFWRESERDGIYNNAVVLVRSSKNSNARFIGSQPQAQLEWDIDRHATFILIYAHFIAGPFLRETGPAKDVDYITTWLAYKF